MQNRDQHAASSELTQLFQLAVREERFNEAERILDELRAVDPDTAARPVFTTMLMLAQGDALRALQNLAGVDAPELRAYCLYMLGDPSWEGLARSLADESLDFGIRLSMGVLLGEEASII